MPAVPAKQSVVGPVVRVVKGEGKAPASLWEPEEPFVVESGVPVPLTARGNAESIYRPALSKMKVGDFFHMPGAGEAQAGSVREVAKRLKLKITTRINYMHKGRKGVGVWRLKDS